MATTLTIPLTTLPVGTTNFPSSGGQSVPDSDTQAVVTIDRTVSGGLNSVSSSVSLAIDVFLSTDSGATWIQQAGVVVPGGLIFNRHTNQNETVSGFGVSLPGRTGKLARVVVTATGGSVAVSGTLVLS